MLTIQPLKKATKTDLVSLNDLIKQLRSNPTSHKQISSDRLRTILGNKNSVVLVVRDGKKIIGTGTLFYEDIFTGRDGSLEDVVIDSNYRGRGLGVRLVSALIKVARIKKVGAIFLTSRPSRIAANKLYKKMGFKKKETNNYEMHL